MLKLQAIQERFLDAVLRREMRDHKYINNGDIIPSPERLNVYRANIFSNHLLALTDTYPVCKKLVGENYFRQLADSYLWAYPPKVQDLNEYGGYFAEHLEYLVTSRADAANLPFLPDMARLEWAVYQSRRAKIDPAFDFCGLDRLSEKQRSEVMFTLSASLSLLSSKYPIHLIWESNSDGLKPSHQINLDQGECNLVIWSIAWRPMLRAVEWSKYQILEAIQQNKLIADLTSVFGESVQSFIPGLVAARWIVGWKRNHSSGTLK